MKESQFTEREIREKHRRLHDEAESDGYHLNPDEAFTRALVEGLLANIARYGYQACPCRLASGVKADDNDIICPCDYRDADISEYGACFCGLYVNNAILRGQQQLQPVPERRGQVMENKPEETGQISSGKLSQPVWRCRVCGYLCARPEAPENCPICKVGKERFEHFI